MKLVPFLALIIITQACNETQPEATNAAVNSSVDSLNPVYAVDSCESESDRTASNNYYIDQQYKKEHAFRETRLRYKNFTLVFHDFKGYDVRWNDDGVIDYGYLGDSNSVVLNIKEKYSQDEADINYKETLIVKVDTLRLSEDFGDDPEPDNRIDSTLLEIIPNNKEDYFKISMYLPSYLGEVIDYRKYTEAELEKLNKKRISYKEKINIPMLSDSSHLKFITPSKRTIYDLYDKDYHRVQKKYQMRDTSFVIESEGGGYTADLTKNGKLFSYDYGTYFFRIDRFRNGKLIETKFIEIEILSGC